MLNDDSIKDSLRKLQEESGILGYNAEVLENPSNPQGHLPNVKVTKVTTPEENRTLGYSDVTLENTCIPATVEQWSSPESVQHETPQELLELVTWDTSNLTSSPVSCGSISPTNVESFDKLHTSGSDTNFDRDSLGIPSTDIPNSNGDTPQTKLICGINQMSLGQKKSHLVDALVANNQTLIQMQHAQSKTSVTVEPMNYLSDQPTDLSLSKNHPRKDVSLRELLQSGSLRSEARQDDSLINEAEQNVSLLNELRQNVLPPGCITEIDDLEDVEIDIISEAESGVGDPTRSPDADKMNSIANNANACSGNVHDVIETNSSTNYSANNIAVDNIEFAESNVNDNDSKESSATGNFGTELVQNDHTKVIAKFDKCTDKITEDREILQTRGQRLTVAIPEKGPPYDLDTDLNKFKHIIMEIIESPDTTMIELQQISEMVTYIYKNYDPYPAGFFEKVRELQDKFVVNHLML